LTDQLKTVHQLQTTVRSSIISYHQFHKNIINKTTKFNTALK